MVRHAVFKDVWFYKTNGRLVESVSDRKIVSSEGNGFTIKPLSLVILGEAVTFYPYGARFYVRIAGDIHMVFLPDIERVKEGGTVEYKLGGIEKY